MDISAAISPFVVTLREGVEAALVVGIVFACLQKAQQTQLSRWIYAGVGAGIGASVLVGVILGGILSRFAASPVIQEFLEAGLGLVAVAMLSWMLIWMTQQSKFLKTEVEGAIYRNLQESSSAGWGIFTVIFIAVLREGFETVIFITAKFQEGWGSATVGAAAGLSGAILIGLLLFKLGIKINLRLFFQGMGALLLLIVGGLVIGVLKHFDGAISLLPSSICFSSSTSCILGPQVWNASDILPDGEFPGILLKALLGYRETLYLAQAVAYVLFMSIVGGLYFQSLNPQPETSNAQR